VFASSLLYPRVNIIKIVFKVFSMIRIQQIVCQLDEYMIFIILISSLKKFNSPLVDFIDKVGYQ